jgi:hypothetical protein
MVEIRGAQAHPRRAARPATSHIIRVSLIAAIVLPLALGCDRDAASDPLAGSTLPHFTISEQPTVTLADDGTPEKLFSSVSARRLPSGELVVGDQGSTTIRIFARDGRLQRTLARRGNGPGELPGPFALSANADTILAFGQAPTSPPNVHMFAAGTGFVSRMRPMTDSIPLLTALGRLNTGQLLVQRGGAFKPLARLPDPGTLWADSMTYGLFSSTGNATHGTVTWLRPVVRQWLFAYPRRTGPLPTGLATYTLGPTTTVLASGDRVWLIDGESGQLLAVDGTGRELVSTRLSVTPRPFDRARLEQLRARSLAAATREVGSAKVKGMFDPSLLPRTMPLVSTAYAGADDEVWVRLFDLDEKTAPQRFVVVNREGVEIAQATLPAGLDVQHIGANFVLGVRRDSVGVESVLEYALRR